MKKCTKCGAENDYDALFCSECGYRLNLNVPAAPSDGHIHTGNLNTEAYQGYPNMNKNTNASSAQQKLQKPIKPTATGINKTVIICIICLLIISTAVLAACILNRGLKEKRELKETSVSSAIQTEFSKTEKSTSSTVNSDDEIQTITESFETIFSTDASSVLADQVGFNYSSENLIDNNISTCWAEGADGSGIGETIVIRSNNTINLNKITINNGYCKSEKLFYENNRVKKIRVTFDDKESIILDLNGNYFDFENAFNIPEVQTSKIVFEILDVYKGTTWDDTCISDIILN